MNSVLSKNEASPVSMASDRSTYLREGVEEVKRVVIRKGCQLSQDIKEQKGKRGEEREGLEVEGGERKGERGVREGGGRESEMWEKEEGRRGREGGTHRLRSMKARLVFPCSLHMAPAW